MKKHVLLLANDSTYTYNLRLDILEKLIEEGYRVTVVNEVLKFEKELRDLGINVIGVKTGRHGTNPFADLKLLSAYIKILKVEKPDVVISYNIKPNVYGGVACRLLKIKRIQNITGLGTPLENPGKLQKLSILLYKTGTYNAETLMFQNQSNLDFFKEHKMLSNKTKTVLLPGSGVSLKKHKLIDYPEDGNINFLFVSRILKEKGIDQYLDCAKEISKKHNNVVFNICGYTDDSKYLEILENAQKEGYVKYHGEQKNMNEWFGKSHCLLHPSYYPEGMSNVLLEAAASGRPIITTDRAGCKEIIDDGINGFIVKQRNSLDLIQKVEKFISLTYEEKKQMGLNGRQKIEREFDRQIVVAKYLEEIDALLK